MKYLGTRRYLVGDTRSGPGFLRFANTQTWPGPGFYYPEGTRVIKGSNFWKNIALFEQKIFDFKKNSIWTIWIFFCIIREILQANFKFFPQNLIPKMSSRGSFIWYFLRILLPVYYLEGTWVPNLGYYLYPAWTWDYDIWTQPRPGNSLPVATLVTVLIVWNSTNSIFMFPD